MPIVTCGRENKARRSRPDPLVRPARQLSDNTRAHEQPQHRPRSPHADYSEAPQAGENPNAQARTAIRNPGYLYRLPPISPSNPPAKSMHGPCAFGPSGAASPLLFCFRQC